MSPASNELPGFFICHTIYIFAEKDKATMSKYLSILFLCCLPTWLWAGENYRFRVYLKDKGDDGFRVEEPEAYLSRQAIERRAKNDIAVTDADFPISRSYIAMLSETGATPVVQSKWFATVVVESPDSTVAEQLQLLIPSSGFGKGTCGFRPRKSGKIVLCRRMNRYIMNMAIPINRSRC